DAPGAAAARLLHRLERRVPQLHRAVALVHGARRELGHEQTHGQLRDPAARLPRQARTRHPDGHPQRELTRLRSARHDAPLGSPGVAPLDGFRLDGEVGLVTGASSGLGARFAAVLDAVGARVAITARRRDRLDALAARLTDPIVVDCDVTDAGARAELIPRIVDAAGRIDVVVNNAGRAGPMAHAA